MPNKTGTGAQHPMHFSCAPAQQQAGVGFGLGSVSHGATVCFVQCRCPAKLSYGETRAYCRGCACSSERLVNSPAEEKFRRLNKTFYGGSCGFGFVSLI